MITTDMLVAFAAGALPCTALAAAAYAGWAQADAGFARERARALRAEIVASELRTTNAGLVAENRRMARAGSHAARVMRSMRKRPKPGEVFANDTLVQAMRASQ